jgi:small GTP-binding protein
MNSYSLQTETTLIDKLAALYNELEHEDDQAQAQKIIDLIKKSKDEELIIGFAGHFSAGKSTMINHLVGEEILPSSPIPTSANVVKVKSGKPYVRIYYTKSLPEEFKDEYELDEIKSLCKDGETINSIEISRDIPGLSSNVALMDTPGIDSANDVDRIITESSLHLVDVLFYVMDYNHVQSEVNLAFLKEMQQKNKTFYVIINQVDKHQEEELSFTAFENSVQQALVNWGIEPKGVFYTSLKEKNHKRNQFSALQKLFQQLELNKDKILRETALASAKSIINVHMSFIKKGYQEKLETLQDQLDQLKTMDNMNSLIGDEVPNPEELEQRLVNAEQEFKNGLDTIFKNAYLMPFENREKAKLFLEAEQPQFKTGLFFSKKKTELERENRLKDFYQSLMETAVSQLEWHIKELFQSLSKKYDVAESTLQEEIQHFTLVYEKHQLKKLVKQGAQVSGDYVLVYTNDVVHDLKSKVKRDCISLWEKLFNIMEKSVQTEKAVVENKNDRNKTIEKINQSISEIYQLIEEKNNLLYTLLTETNGKREQLVLKVNRIIQNQEDVIQPGNTFKVKNTTDKQTEIVETPSKERLKESSKSQQSVPETLEKLEHSETLIKNLKGFTSISNDLKRKQERLKNRHFTVALFGAFSAGKSSFANALLGENVLPVSPNPTTATINKISPSNQNFDHGDVLIQLKTEAQLIEDIVHAIDQPKKASGLFELVEWMKSLDLSKYANSSKNLSFIQALLEGFETLKGNLGQQITIRLDDAAPFIKEEKKACFVEWMEIFYDCPTTESGITLVDTPGADSVNARHTDVAFEYIKDADAILFVTYYNHAFSRADREFLIQLGRVKDVFSLDKMFFIINASDLAKDEEELKLVTDYVTEQLTHYGIRDPRMYPVSSKLAIQEKNFRVEEQKSGIQGFKDDFHFFIQNELTGLFIQAANYDLKRTVNTLANYIESASMDKERKTEIKQQYLSDQDRMENHILSYDISRLEKSIEQEIKELCFYIHQRVFLRFTDIFKEFFNPANIQSSGKKGRQEIEKVLHDFLHFLNHDLTQEMQATSLRVENFINKRMSDLSVEIVNDTLFKQYKISLPEWTEGEFQTPKYVFSLDEHKPNFDKALSHYKNSKSFFEDNMKEKTKEDLESHLKPLVKTAIENKEEQIYNHYIPQLQEEVKKWKDTLQYAVNEYFEGLLYNVSDNVDVNELIFIYDELMKKIQ